MHEALAVAPDNAEANFNMGLLKGEQNDLNQKGDSGAATKVLNNLIREYPAYPNAYILLGQIYEEQGKKAEAKRIYGRALTAEGIPDTYKYRMRAQLETLK